MRQLRSIFLRLRNLFQRQRCESEMAEELASTLQMHIDENMSSGMSAEAARYAALRSFGGVDQTKEECRDARGLAFIESLLQDIRFGVRMLVDLLRARQLVCVCVNQAHLR